LKISGSKELRDQEFKMDRLDKLSILIIVILVASLMIVSLEYQGADENNPQYRIAKENAVIASEIPPDIIRTLKNLIADNNIKKAAVVLDRLLDKYPYDGEPHILMGDVMMRKQDPVAAMNSYRKAIDLNPDYVDKKTPLFQGRKIKNTVNEAKEIIDNALSKSPGNKEMKKAKKTIYYILRKLAGSCG
jgi:cytochrome c-type biogenesis protein CcmH/NrfG